MSENNTKATEDSSCAVINEEGIQGMDLKLRSLG